MPFTPAPNFCEENVWRILQEPSEYPRWAVFISTEDRMCTMWAQKTQNGITPVVWDYHVVMLEATPDGFQVWDPDCIVGTTLSSAEWTQANFPNPDPSIRFRVIDSTSFNRDFRSDRRHMKGSARPEWPAISTNDCNLDTYTSVLPGGPGQLFDLESWISFTKSSRNLLTIAN